jgi:hypothetical protein
MLLVLLLWLLLVAALAVAIAMPEPAEPPAPLLAASVTAVVQRCAAVSALRIRLSGLSGRSGLASLLRSVRPLLTCELTCELACALRPIVGRLLVTMLRLALHGPFGASFDWTICRALYRTLC